MGSAQDPGMATVTQAYLRALCGGFVVGALLGLAILAVRGEAQAVSLTDAVAAADRVVFGDVMDVYTEPSPDGTKVITHVTVAPIRMLRGRRDPSGLVDLTFDGGCVDDFCPNVPHAPRVAIDDAFIFLLSDASPVGNARGALKVSELAQKLPASTRSKIERDVTVRATTAELIELVEHLVERTASRAPLYASAR